jgi:hypothetical protein
MEISTFDLHEKSLDLSNYEIFPQKILKSRTFKKSSILIVIKSKGYENCSTELILTHFDENCNSQQKPASRDEGLASWLSSY